MTIHEMAAYSFYQKGQTIFMLRTQAYAMVSRDHGMKPGCCEHARALRLECRQRTTDESAKQSLMILEYNN